MDRYFESYREMISLRGLTGHTLKGYCTYIRAYLDYLQRILCKRPEDVSYRRLWSRSCIPPDCGISEVCRLRYEDISRSRMRIFIRHGKNRQSRYAILSQAALDILTQYWCSCGRPMGYLFPKQSSLPVYLSVQDAPG